MSTPESAVWSIAEAAALLGIGRQTAYDLIRRGEFPLPVLQLGRRKVIAKAVMARYLTQEPA